MITRWTPSMNLFWMHLINTAPAHAGIRFFSLVMICLLRSGKFRWRFFFSCFLADRSPYFVAFLLRFWAHKVQISSRIPSGKKLRNFPIFRSEFVLPRAICYFRVFPSPTRTIFWLQKGTPKIHIFILYSLRRGPCFERPRVAPFHFHDKSKKSMNTFDEFVLNASHCTLWIIK